MDLWSDIIAMEYPFSHICRVFLALFKGKKTVNIECLLVTRQPFPLVSAKAQSRGAFGIGLVLYHTVGENRPMGTMLKEKGDE